MEDVAHSRLVGAEKQACVWKEFCLILYQLGFLYNSPEIQKLEASKKILHEINYQQVLYYNY